MKSLKDICNVNIPNSLHSLLEASILGDNAISEASLLDIDDTINSGLKDTILSKMKNLKNGDNIEEGIELLRQATENETTIDNYLDIKKFNPEDFIIAINFNNRSLLVIKNKTKTEYFIKGIEVCGYDSYVFSKFMKFNELLKYLHGIGMADLTIKKIESKENIDICQAILDNVKN